VTSLRTFLLLFPHGKVHNDINNNNNINAYLPPPLYSLVKSQIINSVASLRAFLFLFPHGKVRYHINKKSVITLLLPPLCITWVNGFTKWS